MLNAKNVRELAYLVKVDSIAPMNADRLECVNVGGWHVVAGKGEFHEGDVAIYVEIDAQCPIDKTPWSNMEFLVSKHGKIKSQKIRGVVSQGLLVSVTNFGWSMDGAAAIESDGTRHNLNDESRFLTEKLGITYATIEDQYRKGSDNVNKYAKMAQRNPELAKTWWWRKLYKSEIGKRVLWGLFSKRNVNKSWPDWVKKTDEERIQNIPWILSDDSTWIATEKIDGTSTTFSMKKVKKLFKTRYEYYVCSRNVNFSNSSDKCFYNSNVYLEMSKKYNIENVLKNFLDEHPECTWVTIQGETYGEGIQKRTYSIKGHDFVGFNLIDDVNGRWNSEKAAAQLAPYGINWVPILGEIKLDQFHGSVDEILAYATGVSVIDGLPREGIVFRDIDGVKSFKAVSNEYLLKYHG